MTPFARNAIVLGAVTAVGPFAIDMYLPAFAGIAADLKTNQGAVQLSLVTFFVALALGQTVYGPVSDVVGRRKPLLFGLGLFIAASAACGFAPNVETLAALRFVEGAGVCAGMVIARAVVRDLHTGHEAARLFATTLLVLGLSPIFAPLIGSLIVTHGSWRVIFLALSLIGAAATLLVALLLPETRRPDPRANAAPGIDLPALRRAAAQSRLRQLRADRRFRPGLVLLLPGGLVLRLHHGVRHHAFRLLPAVRGERGRHDRRRPGGPDARAPVRGAAADRAGDGRLRAAHGRSAACRTARLGEPRDDRGAGLLLDRLPRLHHASRDHAEPRAARGRGGNCFGPDGTLQFTLGALASFAVSLLFDGTARPLFLIMAATAVASFLNWRVFLAVTDRQAALPRTTAVPR